MIMNNVRHENGQFFTNIYHFIENNKGAYRVIKQYTGHKNERALLRPYLLTRTKPTLFLELKTL